MFKRGLSVFMSIIILISTFNLAYANENIDIITDNKEICKDSEQLAKEWYSNNTSVYVSNKINDVLNDYFDFRNDSFLQKQLDYDNPKLSTEIINDERIRSNCVLNMERKLNIKIINANIAYSIIDVLNDDKDNHTTVNVKEWIFYDYDDLDDNIFAIDTSGYGVDHKIKIENDYHIIDYDSYEEFDYEFKSFCYEENGLAAEKNSIKQNTAKSDLNLFSLNDYSYDVESAVNYADTYALSRNPNYKDYSSDGNCANYVSQCLSAGGLPETADWKPYKTALVRASTLKDYMGDTYGNLITDCEESDIYKGNPVFFHSSAANSGWHATICVGENNAGVPIIDSNTSDKYHIKYTYFIEKAGEKPSTVLISQGTNIDGYLESVSAGQGYVSITGWASDADDTSKALNIHVYVGGPAGSVDGNASNYANQYRADVGSHGFSELVIPTDKTGNQPVYVYAIDAQDPDMNFLLKGCPMYVDIPSNSSPTTSSEFPVGFLDNNGVSGGNGYIDVSGWAFDPDAPDESIYVDIYIGDEHNEAQRILANASRPDVNALYGCGDNHGFSERIYTNQRGSINVYAYGIDATGDDNAQLSDSPCNVYVNSGAAPSVVTSDNETTIYNFLRSELELNVAAACGVLANIAKESGFENDLYERGYSHEAAGYGICQWTNYPRTSGKGRKTDLINWCRDNGYDYTSLTGQLYFLKHELETGYSAVYTVLTTISDDAEGAYDAGYIWCSSFEKPAGNENGEVSHTRGFLASEVYWPKYGEYEEILSCIDDSSVDSSNNAHISGWVIALSDINRLTYSINGGSEITYNDWYDGSDVYEHYPDYPASGEQTPCRFKIDIPSSNFRSGTNTVRLKAYANNGEEQEIYSYSFNIGDGINIKSWEIKYLNNGGYTAYVTVEDDSDIVDVKFPTKNDSTDWIWLDASGQDGNTWWCDVDVAKYFNNAQGNYTTHIYVYNNNGESTGVPCETVFVDKTKPTVSNVKVAHNYTGYTVSCTATDNVGIDRVQFPTWTLAGENGGQDDLLSDWVTNPKASGTKNGNTYTFTVRASDHNNETGTYKTHIYAYDKAGNATCYELNNIQYNKYTVSYNANGGTGAPASQTKYTDIDLTLSATKPSRTGYTFQGWATSATATSAAYQPSATYNNNAALTLYAVWKANTYTVAYNANGGTGAPDSQAKTHGTDLTLSTTTPTRTGYTFQGWATSATATSSAYQAGGVYKNNSAVTLYAVWKENTYNVTYNANGGTGAPEAQLKTYGKDLTLSSTAPAREGYTFAGWGISDGWVKFSTGDTYKDNSDVTLYAIWKKIYNDYVPADVFEYNGNIYAIYDEIIDWETAKDFCEKSGGHLVTINDAEENSVITEHAKQANTKKYWIGLNDIENEGVFVWTDGDNSQYRNFNTGQPDNSEHLEHYVEITATGGYWEYGSWNDNKIYTTYTGFILEVEKEDLELSSKKVFNSNLYEFNSISLPYSVAKYYASLKGGHLVSINSDDENNFVADNALNNSVWLGIEKVNGVFKLTTGEKLKYQNWNDNEPDNQNGVENYAVIDKASKEWLDSSNANASGYCIEYEADYGDINLDGVVDDIDAALLLKHLSGVILLDSEQLARANANTDNKIDLLDVIAIQRMENQK